MFFLFLLFLLLQHKAGLLTPDEKSMVTSIFPGPSLYVTFFDQPDWSGHTYTFNSRYRYELTKFHFAGTPYGNDDIKSFRLQSLTTSFQLPGGCKPFRLE